MVKTFLLLSGRVVVHEVLVSPENVGWLHSSTPLRTQDAFNHNASTQVKSSAVVANPVIVWYFINTITSLMNRNVTSSAKDNQVFILVITIVADGTLGVFLDDKATLVGTQRVVTLNV